MGPEDLARCGVAAEDGRSTTGGTDGGEGPWGAVTGGNGLFWFGGQAGSRQEAESAAWWRQEVAEVAAVLTGFSEKEESLDQRAQTALEGMGRGPAAELLGKVVDKGDGIRNPSRYVVSAANRLAKEQEGAEGNEEVPNGGVLCTS